MLEVWRDLNKAAHILDIGSDIFCSNRVLWRVFATFGCGHLESLTQSVDSSTGLSMVRMIVPTEESTLSLGHYTACDIHAGCRRRRKEEELKRQLAFQCGVEIGLPTLMHHSKC